MSNTPYFRAGAGAIIYTETGEIIIFKRSDEAASWQFQQGGMDEGETPERTLWRELYEETGLQKIAFTTVIAYPKWIHYAYPPEIYAQLKRPNTLGQVHRWWFLKLASNVAIDLASAPDQEFSEWKKTTFEEFLPSRVGDWKFEVYKELSDYFTLHIKPTL